MLAAQLIGEAAAKRAEAAPLVLKAPSGSYVPAYLDLVRRHLKRDYAEADLAPRTLRVHQPRSAGASGAERALTANLKRLDAARPARGDRLEEP